jgi:arylsulfatase
LHGKTLETLDGVSLTPALHGQAIERGFLFWEHEGNRAVRKGPWKIVAPSGQPWRLFNLEKDRTELRDVSAENPGIKEELIAAYAEWAKKVGARPGGR